LRAKVVGSDSCITTDMVTMDSNTTGNGTNIPTLVKCTTPTMLVRHNLELMVFIFHVLRYPKKILESTNRFIVVEDCMRSVSEVLK
jgi:hypothetical protein